MKKNYFKIITINLIILIGIILIGDYLYFKCIEFNYREDCKKQNLPYDYSVKYKTYEIIDHKKQNTTNIYETFLEKNLYLEPIITNENRNNAPIILFGCSYTWLHNDTGLQGLLAKYTNRPVFNFSFWGWGGQHTYFLTNNPLLYERIEEYTKVKPEFAIYTYIRDHKNRITNVMDYFIDIEPYLNYKIENGKLVQQKHNFLNKLFFRLFTYRYLLKKYENNEDEYRYNILYLLLIESFDKLKKEYPNITPIMLLYEQDCTVDEYEEKMIQKLKQKGITIISTKNLTDTDLYRKDLTDPDGYHPNPKAWEIIVPKLVKKIKKI